MDCCVACTVFFADKYFTPAVAYEKLRSDIDYAQVICVTPPINVLLVMFNITDSMIGVYDILFP